MRLSFAWPLVALVACGDPSVLVVGAPDAGAVDAGAPDAGVVTRGCRWGTEIGGAGTQFLRSFAADAQGRSVIAGSFTQSLEIGSSHQQGGSEAFVVRLGEEGGLEWSRVLAIADGAVAGTNAAGEVRVGGALEGAFELDAFHVVAAGEHDAFVAKLGDTGRFAWVTSLQAAGVPASGAPAGLAVDEAGATLVFGLTSLESLGLYLAKFDGEGALLWQHTFPVSQSAEASAAAFVFGAPISVSAGGILVSFSLAVSTEGTTLDLGGGPINVGATADNVRVLARFDANGGFGWARVIASPTRQAEDSRFLLASQAVLAGDGGVWLAGSFGGTYDLGCGPLTATEPDEGHLLGHYVARLRVDGTCLASWPTGARETHALAITGDGSVLAAGDRGDTIWTARLGPDGAFSGDQVFGPGAAHALRVAPAGEGDLLVAGSLVDDGGLDLCGTWLQGDAWDTFVARVRR